MPEDNFSETAAAAPATGPLGGPVLPAIEHITEVGLQAITKYGPELVQTATAIAGVSGGGVGPVLALLLKGLLPVLVGAL
jgi:hypothetical protein